jgi:hypothetical protein
MKILKNAVLFAAMLLTVSVVNASNKKSKIPNAKKSKTAKQVLRQQCVTSLPTFY